MLPAVAVATPAVWIVVVVSVVVCVVISVSEKLMVSVVVDVAVTVYKSVMSRKSMAPIRTGVTRMVDVVVVGKTPKQEQAEE